MQLFTDMIFEIYVQLMMLIFPKKNISDTARFVLDIAVGIFVTLLIISMLVGAILQLNDEAFLRSIGRYLIVVPAVVTAVQIILGITVHFIARKKR